MVSHYDAYVLLFLCCFLLQMGTPIFSTLPLVPRSLNPNLTVARKRGRVRLSGDVFSNSLSYGHT